MASSVLLSEKRQLARKELIYYLKVSELLNNQEVGRLIDVNAAGLQLIGAKGVPVGKEMLLSVELPKALQKRSLPDIGVRAKAVWTRPSLTRPFIETGMMFLNLNEEAKSLIDLLINLFALPDGQLDV
ncbi:MAG: PilZ domain-containing protein [Deltaproteobacteria bacterium]|jgi:hypothetical protein|nr:PilZ domain-containing protein [Deltaproteobacteria bacterium]